MNENSFREDPENRFDTEMRFKAIKEGAKSHQAKMDDDSRLAVPSHGESLVSDWIMNRVELPEDMVTAKSDVKKVRTVEQPKGDYEKDLIKLQAMARDQLSEILSAVETKSKKDVGLFSKGPLLNGYAIDTKTLQSIQTKDHVTTDRQLAGQISMQLEDDNRDDSIDPENSFGNILGRIIKGSVYLQVPSFKTPIVKLYLGSEENQNRVPQEYIAKIVNHIKNERKLIPIDSYLKPL